MSRKHFVRNRKKRNITILSFLFVFIFLSLGFATLGTQLQVGGQINVDKYSRSLYDTISSSAVMDNVNSTYVNNATPGITFSAVASNTNGRGVYTRSGTENDEYPVHYYRGKVKNNNVFFGGYCWKILRTTSSGGVKLIYNGVKKDAYAETLYGSSDYSYTNDSTYPFSYDADEKTWTSTNHDNQTTSEFSLTIPVAGDYNINYSISSESGYDFAYFYKNGTQILQLSGGEVVTHVETGLTTSDVIKVTYVKDEYDSTGNDQISFSIGLRGGLIGQTCDNVGNDTQLSSTSTFNSDSSAAGVGYMSGASYPQAKYNSVSGAYKYGKGFTYSGGNYTLTNTITTTGTWANDYQNITDHHYTCYNSSGTCSTVYYVILVNTMWVRHVTLTGGKSIGNALDEMLYSSSNANSSTIKGNLESWYSSNLSGYSSYIEDTPFCNDRTTPILNGWDPTHNTSDMKYTLFFGAYNRLFTLNAPSLTCSNNDSFTTSSSIGNGKLSYPVGLVTADEVTLAGGKEWEVNYDYFLYSSSFYWTMSPHSFDISPKLYYVRAGVLMEHGDTNTNFGVRPVISLKSGVLVTGGDGSFLDPYTVQ